MLIVDDEPNIRLSLEGLLMDEGHAVASCADGESALDRIGRETFDAVLLDVMLPGMSGLEVMRRIRESDPEAAVVMMSGRPDTAMAVSAVQAGARQFLEKPLDPDRLLFELRNLETHRVLATRVASLEGRAADERRWVGESVAVRRLLADVAKAAPTDGRVLVFGENGTGKELVARMVHDASRRREKPFVSLNCAAVPQALVESELFGYEKGAFTGAGSRKPGLFETAHGGTLFLDEIGDMPADTQAKLLRVLQESEAVRVGGTVPVRFDARVIAATNKDLSREIGEGRFREDLFYRLNVIPLHVPPLRERGEDVILLARFFLERLGRSTGKGMMEWNPKALDLLRTYDWPGNVRELRNTVERLVIMSESREISEADARAALPAGRTVFESLPSGVQADPELSLAGNLARYEKALLEKSFREAEGNVSLLSRMLKTDRANLYRKLKSYGIK
ncbi:sigma-54-dependent Fis family transcriptional regulator [bacterium]|nr:sigma-54-dependent Fis family transcriptional regulator [bacterium]